MANPQRHQYKVHKATTCGKHRGRSARPSYIAGSCKLLFALLMDVLNVPKHRTTKIPLAIFFFFFPTSYTLLGAQQLMPPFY